MLPTFIDLTAHDFFLFCSWTIGFSAASTIRRALSRNSTPPAVNQITPMLKTRSRELWHSSRRPARCLHLRRRRRPPLHPPRRRRWTITCTSTRRTRCRASTRTRAARSTWCRRSSLARGRCRASPSGRSGKIPSTFPTITWMPL